MNLNAPALLALLSELYAQVNVLTDEVAALRKQLADKPVSDE